MALVLAGLVMSADADNDCQRQSHLHEVGNRVFARPIHHQVGLVACGNNRGANHDLRGAVELFGAASMVDG